MALLLVLSTTPLDVIVTRNYDIPQVEAEVVTLFKHLLTCRLREDKVLYHGVMLLASILKLW